MTVAQRVTWEMKTLLHRPSQGLEGALRGPMGPVIRPQDPRHRHTMPRIDRVPSTDMKTPYTLGLSKIGSTIHK